MEYVEAVDLGEAPEIFISGISKIERIGPGTVRFTFYSERDNCKRVVLHTVWDLKKWLDEATIIADAGGMLRYGPNSIDCEVHSRAS